MTLFHIEFHVPFEMSTDKPYGYHMAHILIRLIHHMISNCETDPFHIHSFTHSFFHLFSLFSFSLLSWLCCFMHPTRDQIDTLWMIKKCFFDTLQNINIYSDYTETESCGLLQCISWCRKGGDKSCYHLKLLFICWNTAEKLSCFWYYLCEYLVSSDSFDKHTITYIIMLGVSSRGCINSRAFLLFLFEI